MRVHEAKETPCTGKNGCSLARLHFTLCYLYDCVPFFSFLKNLFLVPSPVDTYHRVNTSKNLCMYAYITLYIYKSDITIYIFHVNTS